MIRNHDGETGTITWRELQRRVDDMREAGRVNNTWNERSMRDAPQTHSTRTYRSRWHLLIPCFRLLAEMTCIDGVCHIGVDRFM